MYRCTFLDGTSTKEWVGRKSTLEEKSDNLKKTHTDKVKRTDSFGFGEDMALTTAPVGFGEETTYNHRYKNKEQRNTKKKKVRPRANRQHKNNKYYRSEGICLWIRSE